MSKRKKGGGIKALIVVLVIALLAVAVLIAWKQWEYGTSEEFYNGLRGALQYEGARA